MKDKEKIEHFLQQTLANKGILYKVAHAYSRCDADREDLIQEILLQLWRSSDKYNGVTKYSTWMYTIALNTAISFYRKEHRKKSVTTHLQAHHLEWQISEPVAEPPPEVAILHQFIQQLPPFDKALLLLYLDEKSQKEMAAIMGITTTNVSTKINRIKASFAKMYPSKK